MKIIEFEDRIIYRADKNKKVKFVNNNIKFDEIVVDITRKNFVKIVEVDK